MINNRATTKEGVIDEKQPGNKPYKSDYKHIKPVSELPTYIFHFPFGYTGSNEFVDFVNELPDEAADVITEKQKLNIAMLSSMNDITRRNFTLRGVYENLTSEHIANPIIEGKTIRPRVVTPKIPKDGGEVSGDQAIAIFNNIIDLSGIYQIPLWNSGFHITLKNIPDTDITNLYMKLVSNANGLGRETGGLLFANTGYLQAEVITDFILERVHACSLDVPHYELKKYIKVPDIQNLYILLMRYIFSKGYETSIICKNAGVFDEENRPKCDYIARAKVNPLSMLRVLDEKINKAHRLHMAKRGQNVHTVDEVLKYQESLKAIENEIVEIKDEDDNALFSIELKTPSLEERFDSANLWKEFIRVKVNEIIAIGDNAEKKDRLEENIAMKSAINMYHHYVDALIMGDTYLRDRDTLIKQLENFSSVNHIRSQILKAILNYISNRTVSFVGIKAFECEKCHEINCGEAEGTENIVPIDMTVEGFSILEEKVRAIQESSQQPLL